MSNKKLFSLTLLSTTAIALLYWYITRPPALTPLGDDIYISSQLGPHDLRNLAQLRIRSIVDLRPDGESADQPSHTQIESAAKAQGMDFYYIPIPHDTIPPDSVDALTRALGDHSKSTLLYCRTGRRAARTYALAEAARPDGPTAPAILRLVHTAGFSAEDLLDNINTRIATRPIPTPKN